MAGGVGGELWEQRGGGTPKGKGAKRRTARGKAWNGRGKKWGDSCLSVLMAPAHLTFDCSRLQLTLKLIKI